MRYFIVCFRCNSTEAEKILEILKRLVQEKRCEITAACSSERQFGNKSVEYCYYVLTCDDYVNPCNEMFLKDLEPPAVICCEEKSLRDSAQSQNSS